MTAQKNKTVIGAKTGEVSKIIEIKNLYKKFGEIQAVDNLNFSVRKGELFAFLGVNGAGKSTTISIMCGQMERDGGTVFIDGKNIDNNIFSVKSCIGVVFQSSVLDKVLTVKDNLKTRAALYGITGEEFEERLNQLDEMLSVKELCNRPVGKLSGGQRRRVDIARALIHNPKILILDEPTTGLDPQTRKTVWNVIDKLRKDGDMTVLLTTHYMEEAAEADYVIIIDSGSIVAEGTPVDLKNQFTGDFINIYTDDENEIKQLGEPYRKIRDGFRLTVENTSKATELILKYPKVFLDYEISKGKMDDVFLAATGKKLMGDEK